MENKIKTLYILSIIAIVSFLGMQGYWLYNRYEYSVKEYEDYAFSAISKSLVEYANLRPKFSKDHSGMRYQSSYQMNTDVDSARNPKRTVNVETKIFDGRSLLGITEDRDLTQEEKQELLQIMIDSLIIVEQRKAEVDVTSAPSDAVAWAAMKNFEIEIESPYDTAVVDSLLQKENIHADISLIVTDSLLWSPITTRHTSLIKPGLKVISPYSELERKAVVIECEIPSSEILQNMGWTLALAVVLSLFLVLCLVWQIKTIAKLTRLDKMRTSFITTMIHELKRPISTLKMCVSGIDNDKLMQDDQLRHELTAETRIALDNLSAYFSKLRDISFNNVEQIPLNITSFNLSELVDNVLKSISLPSNKVVTFENNVPEGLEVSADSSHLMNIFTNLIENAIKYSGDSVTIKITAQATTDGCHIAVEDNGNGISSADSSKIFNRFYRGKMSSTDIPGMGLGLAYVKLLAEAHGGIISVESEEGIGSKFNITIPQ